MIRGVGVQIRVWVNRQERHAHEENGSNRGVLMAAMAVHPLSSSE